MEKVESRLERTKPDFNIKDGLKSITFGLGLIVLFTFFIFMYAQILFRGNIATITTITLAAILHQWYFWIILLFIFSMLLLYIFVGMNFVIFGVSIFIKGIYWLSKAGKVQAIIVDRRITVHTEYDEYSEYLVTEHELELKYTPIQAITNPREWTIWAHVDKFVFEKNEHRDTACIHYSVVDPSIFLIEGE